MEIAKRGSLRDISLVKILVFLNRNRKTGTLSVTGPAWIKKIYLKAGDAVFASSTYEDDRLGEMLLKAGKITVEQYDRSVALLRTSNKRQGAILVEEGYLSPKELFWGVKYQVEEIILGLFQLDEGEYEFLEGDLPRDEVITLRMSMGNLIYAGVSRIDNWTRIRREMPDTDSVVRISEDPLSLFQDIELSHEHRSVLSLVDGTRPVRALIDNSPLGAFDALKILYVLWSLGIIEGAESGLPMPGRDPAGTHGIEEMISLDEILSPQRDEEEGLLRKIEALYPMLETLNPWELLEVDAQADFDTVKANYFRLAKEFHPDRGFTEDMPEIKPRLTEIFDALSRAYAMVKEQPAGIRNAASSAAPGEPSGDDEAARERFSQGITEFKRGNYWGAVDLFKSAAALMPSKAAYWSSLSLAYTKIPGKLREAEEALLSAIDLEPENPDLHANMGLLYLKAGVRERATAAFERALEVDPANEKAQRGIRQAEGEALS